MTLTPNKRTGDKLKATEWNKSVQLLTGLAKSLGVNAMMDSSGLHIRKTLSGPTMLIAEVDTDASGGGYYNCHLQTLDSTDWNTNTPDQLDDRGDSVVVLNLVEIGTTAKNSLDAGDLILCWKIFDDEGESRLVGHEIMGRYTFRRW